MLLLLLLLPPSALVGYEEARVCGDDVGPHYINVSVRLKRPDLCAFTGDAFPDVNADDACAGSTATVVVVATAPAVLFQSQPPPPPPPLPPPVLPLLIIQSLSCCCCSPAEGIGRKPAGVSRRVVWPDAKKAVCMCWHSAPLPWGLRSFGLRRTGPSWRQKSRPAYLFADR